MPILTIVFLFLFGLLLPSYAGMSIGQRVVLTEIDVLNCQSGGVSGDHSELILDAEILSQRSIFHSFLLPTEDNVAPWQTSVDHARRSFNYRQPVGPKMKAATCRPFPVGKHVVIEQYDDTGCDTVPAVGDCILSVRHQLARPVSERNRRYLVHE